LIQVDSRVNVPYCLLSITALKHIIELDEDLAEDIAEEEDLKPLAAMAEFKKLLAGKPRQ
jgi:hypothetical protein